MPRPLISIKSLLEEIEREDSRSIIITLPSNINWEDYQKELDKVKNGQNVINFKVGQFPKGVKAGDRCYLTHKGYVIGWMTIAGLSEKEFVCSTTGKKWVGKFIERSGPFHYLDEKIPMKGFQGFRYFSPQNYKA